MTQFDEVIRFFENNPGVLEPQCSAVEKKETHISVVLLTKSFAFKFKKPVSLGFIEQMELAARLDNCYKENTLNARLSDGIYLGCRGVHAEGNHFVLSPKIEGAIEYCVQMRRLDEAFNLLGLLRRNAISYADCDRIALHLARFHANCHRSGSATHLYQFKKNIDDNVKALRQSGRCDETLFAEVSASYGAAEATLGRRLKQGRIIDGHGDLRLEHVYMHDGRCDMIDCVEFNASIRAVDPLEDIAFLSLGFRMENRPDLAEVFLNAYLSYSLDPDPDLLRLFEVYRATVRMKVDLIQIAGATDASRIQYLNDRFNQYGKLAHELLQKKSNSRPAIIMLMGPPLSGKSTRARELSLAENAVILSTDVARKRLLDTDVFEDLSAEFEAKLYSARMKSHVYNYVYGLAARYLSKGVSVVLDATFSKRATRERFAQLAARNGIEMRTEMLDIDATVAGQRIAERKLTPSISDLKDLETWKKIRQEFDA